MQPFFLMKKEKGEFSSTKYDAVKERKGEGETLSDQYYFTFTSVPVKFGRDITVRTSNRINNVFSVKNKVYIDNRRACALAEQTYVWSRRPERQSRYGLFGNIFTSIHHGRLVVFV